MIQQEFAWTLPQDSDILKRHAAYSGIIAAVRDWPDVIHDAAVLEAWIRSCLVLQRDQHRNLTNDFATYVDLFIVWYTYGYQFQIVRYTADDSNAESMKAVLEIVNQENAWEQVYQMALTLDG